MTKINITIANLLELDRQRNALRGSFIELINLNRINTFYQSNGMRIMTAHEKRTAILEKYFVVENGAVRMRSIPANPDLPDDKPKQVPQLLEGKTQEDFEKEMQEYFAKEVTIEI